MLIFEMQEPFTTITLRDVNELTIFQTLHHV